MKRKIKSVSDQHQDWLAQIDTEGPFLALPVVKDIWPQGVDCLGDADDRMITFKQAAVQWQRALDEYTESARSEEAKEHYGRVNRAWIELVLDRLAGWQDLRVAEPDARLADVEITSPGGEIAVRPSAALEGRDKDLGALLLVSAPTTDLRATGLDGWAATEIDRMAMLLRKARVEVGIVTDGQWWAIVWAKDGKPTGSGVVDALTWAEEPLRRDAFLTLIDQRRFRAKDSEQRLPHLFERSELEAEVITEALGTQVRKSVELLVQAFSEARLAAVASGAQDPLAEKPDDVYQAAVTIMMRVVFLLFAEERDMLPTEQLYWSSYAISDLLDDLQQRAADGEEHLDDTFDVWHRLLAVSEALYAGVNYDEMRMPAYGGSLLDPDRFPWLNATDSRGLRLKVSDRVMLHVFDSVQSVVVKSERRRITFRDIDVEQIGYMYEGLLGYTCRIVEDDVVLGLVGKDGEEPEIPLGTLQRLYDDSTSSKAFANSLTAWVTLHQPAATLNSVSVISKVVEKALTKDAEAEFTRLLTPVAGQDRDLLAQLVDWGHLIRRDLRGIPYVVPSGGLIVGETPSRKNAGAHYTPRSLAEEIVKHALEPLVYEPGPLATNDANSWSLKSSTEILDLRVVDIAAGSGAFLVAAARFLADRVTEAWTAEDTLSSEERANSKLATDRAVREVIARCLYGADINPMAVEMCKLSLWLVSMDRTKPFSFVDDKVFCGNSLLGIVNLDQLRAIHLYPDPGRNSDLLRELIDVDSRIAEAARLRSQLASPIEDHDPMRSSRGKSALLGQFHAVTADLKLVADGIISTSLRLGGRRGPKLDDALKTLSWQLLNTFQGEKSTRDWGKLEKQINLGLTPTVPTDYGRWQPLHWVLEAPDVFVQRGGFDAVVGNPPFLGGRGISPSQGENVRDWLVTQLVDGARGGADLCVYFMARAFSLLNNRGQLAQIGTDSIAQGDSRTVGLERLLAKGGTITRARRSEKWPTGGALLQIAIVWISRVRPSPSAQNWCDGALASHVTSLLEPRGRIDGLPKILKANGNRAFQGSIVLGGGFVVDQETAHSWIESDTRYIDVVRPYLIGRDLSSRPDCSPSRWVVDFGERSIEEASRYTLPWRHLEQTVLPERATKDPVKYPRMVNEWWKFWNPRSTLYGKLQSVGRALALARNSDTVRPVFSSADIVFSEQVVVFPTSEDADLALLSSNLHQIWAQTYSSTMGVGAGLRYSPRDAYETLPLPEASQRLTAAGSTLDKVRSNLMLHRGIGLTTFYNMVNDPEIQGDPGIETAREIHVEIDEAATEAYGWQDVPLNHGFYTYRQIKRYTISPSARIEILDRLLELNQKLVAEEGQRASKRRGLF